MPWYGDPRDYQHSGRWRDYGAYEDPYRHGHSSRRSSGDQFMTSRSRREVSGGGQAWVSSVDRDDPRRQTGIRYFPETDSFRIPPGKRAGPFVGPDEVRGKDFVRMFPQGNVADLRRRRLEEYMSTGRIANRSSGTDRFGNPWVRFRCLRSVEISTMRFPISDACSTLRIQVKSSNSGNIEKHRSGVWIFSHLHEPGITYPLPHISFTDHTLSNSLPICMTTKTGQFIVQAVVGTEDRDARMAPIPSKCLIFPRIWSPQVDN